MTPKAILVVLGLIFASPGRPQYRRPSAEPSEQISQLLREVKNVASSLKSDISTLDFFAAEEGGLRMYAAMLEVYQDHIAALHKQASRLEEVRKYGSRSQQNAIDRVIPVMQEFVSSAEAVIAIARANYDPSNHTEYRDYYKLNGDLAGEFAKLIAGWADYAATRGALDRLAPTVSAPSALP